MGFLIWISSFHWIIKYIIIRRMTPLFLRQWIHHYHILQSSRQKTLHYIPMNI